MQVVADGRRLIGDSTGRPIRVRYAIVLTEVLLSLIDLRRCTGYHGRHE